MLFRSRHSSQKSAPWTKRPRDLQHPLKELGVLPNQYSLAPQHSPQAPHPMPIPYPVLRKTLLSLPPDGLLPSAHSPDLHLLSIRAGTICLHLHEEAKNAKAIYLVPGSCIKQGQQCWSGCKKRRHTGLLFLIDRCSLGVAFSWIFTRRMLLHGTHSSLCLSLSAEISLRWHPQKPLQPPLLLLWLRNKRSHHNEKPMHHNKE